MLSEKTLKLILSTHTFISFIFRKHWVIPSWLSWQPLLSLCSPIKGLAWVKHQSHEPRYTLVIQSACLNCKDNNKNEKKSKISPTSCNIFLISIKSSKVFYWTYIKYWWICWTTMRKSYNVNISLETVCMILFTIKKEKTNIRGQLIIFAVHFIL